MSIKTQNQITAEITANITDALNHQNTAAKVRQILNDLNDTMFSVINNSTGIIKIGELIGANLNTLADQPVIMIAGTKFIITDVVITNASTDLSATLVNLGQFWSGNSRTGIKEADSNTSLNFLTNNIKFISNINTITIANTGNLINTIIFSLGIAAGIPATADIRVYGYKIS